MNEVKSIKLLMQEDIEYKKYIEKCVNYSTYISNPTRYKKINKEYAFDKENYNIFPYLFKQVLIKIFNDYQIPDAFELAVEDDLVVNDSEIRGSDSKVYNFLNSLNDNDISISKNITVNEQYIANFKSNVIKDNGGYLLTINNKQYTIRSNSFKFKITKSLYRSGEDLKCCIKIISCEESFPIYIVDPKSI